MSEEKEEYLPPQVKYWLSQDIKHDCYFHCQTKSGPTERIGAFKAFLMGYSEPMRCMLQDSDLAEKGDITLEDIQSDTFRDFLKCLYMNCSGVENLSFRKCCNLLYVTDKYLVIQLKDMLVDRLVNIMSSSKYNIFDALSCKVFFLVTRLEIKLTKIVQNEIEFIMSDNLFLDIDEESLLWILNLDPIRTDEISLWQAVLKWASHKTKSYNGAILRQAIFKHLKYIRFCTMSFNDFCEKVVPTDILTHSEVYEICKTYGTKEVPSMELICNDINYRQYMVEKEAGPNMFTFAYSVNDISNLNGDERSGNFKFKNFNWQILVRKRSKSFGFFLSCDGSLDDPDWKCTVSFELILFNYIGKNLTKSTANTFCNERSDWGYVSFCSLEELLTSKKYILNNSITVVVTMTTQRP